MENKGGRREKRNKAMIKQKREREREVEGVLKKGKNKGGQFATGEEVEEEVS